MNVVDKNGKEIKLQEMIRFKIDRYTTLLGIVKSVNNDLGSVCATVCGGGATGDRTVLASNTEIVTRQKRDRIND